MKTLRLLAPAFALMLIGCGNTSAPSSEPAASSDGITLTTSSNGRLTGAYTSAGNLLRFDTARTGDDLFFDLTGIGGRQLIHIETVGSNYEFSYMGGALKMHTTKDVRRRRQGCWRPSPPAPPPKASSSKATPTPSTRCSSFLRVAQLPVPVARPRRPRLHRQRLPGRPRPAQDRQGERVRPRHQRREARHAPVDAATARPIRTRAMIATACAATAAAAGAGSAAIAATTAAAPSTTTGAARASGTTATTSPPSSLCSAAKSGNGGGSGPSLPPFASSSSSFANSWTVCWCGHGQCSSCSRCAPALPLTAHR